MNKDKLSKEEALWEILEEMCECDLLHDGEEGPLKPPCYFSGKGKHGDKCKECHSFFKDIIDRIDTHSKLDVARRKIEADKNKVSARDSPEVYGAYNNCLSILDQAKQSS